MLLNGHFRGSEVVDLSNFEGLNFAISRPIGRVRGLSQLALNRLYTKINRIEVAWAMPHYSKTPYNSSRLALEHQEATHKG
jgi:hypothetical protein